MTFLKNVTLFKERNFVLIWLGQSISALGDRCYEVALIWAVISLTGSTLLISTVLTVNYIPVILLLIIGGVWADQVSPRKIMICSDLLRAFAALVFAVLATLGYISIIAILAIGFLYGLVDAFFSPAAQSLFARTISSEKYNVALSFVRISLELAALIGPALGGALIARYNINAAFFFDAATFLVSAVSLGWMRFKKSPENSSNVPQGRLNVAEFTAGFRFIWNTKGLFAIILLFSLTNALNDVEAVLIPLLAHNVLKLSAAQFGLFGTFAAIGTFSGAFIVNVLGDRIRYHSLIICGGMLLFGLVIIGMGLAQEAWQLYLLYIIFGLTFIIPDLLSSTLWFSAIPEDLRGRVFSVLGTIATSLNPLGLIFAGVLGSVYGVRAGIWIGGGAIVVVSLLVLIYPPARNLDQYVRHQQSTSPNNEAPLLQ